MSNHLGQIYSKTKNSEKYIVLNSQNVELSGNVIFTNGNLEISDNLLFNSFSVYDKISFKNTTNNTSYKIFNNNFLSYKDASLNNVDISGVLSGSSGYYNNTLKYSSHLIPTTNDAFDIGSAEYKVRDLYVSDNSIFIGDKNKLAIDENTGSLIIRKRKDNKIPSGLFDNITNQELESIGLVDKNNIELVKQDINQKIGKQINNLSEMKLEDWKIYSDILNNITGKPIKVMNEIFKPNESDDWEEEKDLNNLLTSKNDASLNNLDISGIIRLPDSSNNGYGVSGEVLTSQGNNKPPVWKPLEAPSYISWKLSTGLTLNGSGVDSDGYHRIKDFSINTLSGVSQVNNISYNTTTGDFTIITSGLYNYSFTAVARPANGDTVGERYFGVGVWVNNTQLTFTTGLVVWVENGIWNRNNICLNNVAYLNTGDIVHFKASQSADDSNAYLTQNETNGFLAKIG